MLRNIVIVFSFAARVYFSDTLWNRNTCIIQFSPGTWIKFMLLSVVLSSSLATNNNEFRNADRRFLPVPVHAVASFRSQRTHSVEFSEQSTSIIALHVSQLHRRHLSERTPGSRSTSRHDVSYFFRLFASQNQADEFSIVINRSRVLPIAFLEAIYTDCKKYEYTIVLITAQYIPNNQDWVY